MNDVAPFPVQPGAPHRDAERALGLRRVEFVFGSQAAGAERTRDEQHRRAGFVLHRPRVVLGEHRDAVQRHEPDARRRARMKAGGQAIERGDVGPGFHDDDEPDGWIELSEQGAEQQQRIRNGPDRRRHLQP